jgi:hypothetical protein
VDSNSVLSWSILWCTDYLYCVREACIHDLFCTSCSTIRLLTVQVEPVQRTKKHLLHSLNGCISFSL